MNYGKIVKLTYDGPVHNVSNSEAARFRLINAYNEHMYPVAVSYGQTQNEIYLHFDNFNNIVKPTQLECLGCLEMGSPDLPFDAFALPVELENLFPVPWLRDYLSAEIDVAGVIQLGFDGKMYGNEYVSAALTMNGNVLAMQYLGAYGKEYLSATLNMSGVYCDANGVPI